MPATSDTYDGLTLSTMLTQILYELGQLSGTTAVYTKFTRAFLVRKLNDRQNKFVFHSQCLRKTAYLLCKTDYKTYKLPINCMDGGIIGKPKYYSASDTYEDLELVTTEWLDDHYEGWLEADSSTPEFAYCGPSYGNIPILGVYPAPDSDGTDFSASTGIRTGTSFPGAMNDYNGTATGAGTATSLQDTATTFTDLGLAAGMAALNVTDGSTAWITVIATNALTTTTLSGGTDNTWTSGDTYNILAGEYAIITQWGDDDIIIFSSTAGGINNLTVPAGNIKVDFIPYPLPFPESGKDAQYPEIPKLYHHDYIMGVVADCLRTFTEGSKEFERADSYDKIFWAAVGQAKGKKKDRPFENLPAKLSPGRRRRV